jgi:hypothetical protein
MIAHQGVIDLGDMGAIPGGRAGMCQMLTTS